MTIEEMIHFWVADCLSFEGMKEVLQPFLQNDDCSNAIVDLVLLDDEGEVEEQVQVVAQESGVEFPSFQEAIDYVSVYYLRQIVTGEIKPHVGAQKIFKDVICSNGYEGKDLLPFEAFYSEYEDFIDDSRVSFYGKEECAKNLDRIDKAVLDLACAKLKERGK